jgi:catechol 2,3-dioxygenase-like lactoylglutathione lyase family enzyme
MITFDHIHIYTADPEHSIHFYEDCLGAERLGAISNAAGAENHLLILGGQFIAIGHFPAGMKPSPPPEVGDGALRNGSGVAHFGINVDDLDEFVLRLAQKGIELHRPVKDAGSLRYAYFSAPDGVVIELTEYRVPRKLTPAVFLLNSVNRSVHLIKKTMAKAMVK